MENLTEVGDETDYQNVQNYLINSRETESM